MGYNVCAKNVVAVCNGINDCLIRHVGLIKIENTERAIKKDNPEKLVQDEKKKYNMCWIPLFANKQKQREIRHAPSYKQLEVKTNRTSFYAEIVTDITTGNSERKYTK